MKSLLSRYNKKTLSLSLAFAWFMCFVLLLVCLFAAVVN